MLFILWRHHYRVWSNIWWKSGTFNQYMHLLSSLGSLDFSVKLSHSQFQLDIRNNLLKVDKIYFCNMICSQNIYVYPCVCVLYCIKSVLKLICWRKKNIYMVSFSTPANFCLALYSQGILVASVIAEKLHFDDKVLALINKLLCVREFLHSLKG